jgi:hypothetical protein
VDFSSARIISPKRTRHSRSGWEGYFPYYAGYPESFVSNVLTSLNLPSSAVVYDPWNGSGTTTFTAASLGMTAIGLDLNPVMAIVAKARLLARTEADSLLPLAEDIVQKALANTTSLSKDDPLQDWFGAGTALSIRAIEQSCRLLLVGKPSLENGYQFSNFSALASTFYVALFRVVTQLATQFRTSNPTWTRRPKRGERRLSASRAKLCDLLVSTIGDMAKALQRTGDLFNVEFGRVEVIVGDATKHRLEKGSVDVVLTSPPYCTRIDYTAATGIQLAVLGPMLSNAVASMSRTMLGSVKVPTDTLRPQPAWGPTCNKLLKEIEGHSSKASSGYYLKTHTDYFQKLFSSLDGISFSLREAGSAIMVVQDSYYKDIHNDLATIVSEMAEYHSLSLRRRVDFPLARTIASSHPFGRKYKKPNGATESVLCLEKV